MKQPNDIQLALAGYKSLAGTLSQDPLEVLHLVESRIKALESEVNVLTKIRVNQAHLIQCLQVEIAQLRGGQQ